MLNSFHMPLVDQDDNLLFWAGINCPEQIFVTLVDEDSLEVGEEDVSALNIPVDHVLIKTLFSILAGL